MLRNGDHHDLSLDEPGRKFVMETRCSIAIEGETRLALKLEATKLCIFKRNPRYYFLILESD
jgi:hypothetical protein